MNQRRKGIILAVITAVMWGIMGMFVRDMSQYRFSNIEISFFRCALAGAAYFVFLLVTKPKALKIDLKGLVICVVYGAIAYSISFVSYSVAVSRIPVGVATVLMFMSPIWVAILGIFMFGEKLKKDKVITICICFVGAILVANLIGAGDIRLDGIGILAGVINGIGVALQILLPKFFAKDYDRDTLLVYGFLGAALVLAFGTDFQAMAGHIAGTPTLNLVVDLFGIGILCTMVANVACVKSTQYVEATTTSILSALEV
ncbi:MAG: DMT family transporter, partial [Bacillota bacterium]|nr:DMT family transporter [Bacillota bacterium]